MAVRLVAVTTDRRALGPPPSPSDRVRPRRAEVHLAQSVVSRLRAVGLEPLLIPPHEDVPEGFIERMLGMVDGVVIPGGAFDIHPRHYGQSIAHRVDHIDEGRTALELALARAALDANMPLLGICGGMQVLAVAAGGTLIQDIGSQVPGALNHEQPTDPATPWHSVAFSGGPLRDALGPHTQVNSTHHQAIASAGALEICGRAPDGVAESVHHPAHRFVVGVQWHPELLLTPLFAAFAARL